MSADECSTNHAMKTFVDLSDPIKNTTKGSAILQPTSLIDTPKLHPSACNQQGNSPAVSNLHPRTLTPRYMSPTIASISQASTASTAQVETRNTTPTQGLAPLKAPKARSWFTTALSLSGIGRPSDGGPRSKKERAISHSVDSIKDRGLSEPKRPSKTSPVGLQKTEGSPRLQLSKSLPTEKALPSTPVGQALTTGTPVAQRGLLDASDPPLRRPLPAKVRDLKETEEWPVLLLQSAAGSDASQNLTRGDDSNADSPCASVKLNGGQSPEKITRSVDTLLPQHSIATGATSNGISNRRVAIGSTAIQLQRKPVARPTQQRPQCTSNPLCDTFPGATAIQKFKRGTTQQSNCGRARASSLRANISASSPSTDLGAEAIGFADSTVGGLVDIKPLSGVSGNVGRPAPHIRITDRLSRLPTKSVAVTSNNAAINSRVQNVRSVSRSPPLSQATRQGSLKDGVVTATMQAKTKNMNSQQKENITGKGEPHRGGMTSHVQRGPNIPDTAHACDIPPTASLGLDAGASLVGGRPHQPTKSTNPGNPDPKPFDKKSVLIAQASTSSRSRPSSVPIFRKEASPLGYSCESDTEVTTSKRYIKTACNSFAFFEDDQLSGDADVDTDGMVSPEGTTATNTETSTATEACTPHASRGLKRKAKIPSRNLPRLGPVLRISPIADSIIMGRTSSGNMSPDSGQKVSPALHRNVVINELRKSSKHLDKYFARERDRQTSAVNRRASSKLPLSRPKSASCDLKRMCGLTAAGDQKSWSVDVEKLIFKQEMTTQGGVVISSMEGSRNDDPFTGFQQALVRKNGDTVEPREGVALQGDHEDPKRTSGYGGTRNSELARTTAAVKLATEITKVDASVSHARTLVATPGVAPRSGALQVRIGESPGWTGTRSDSLLGTKLSSNKSNGSRVAHRPPLATLQRTPASAYSTGCVRPPRSSSRVVVPDYTTGSSSAIGSTSKESAASPSPSKDFIEVQNQLGSSRGVGSTPLAISASRDIAPPSQLIYNKVADGTRLSDTSKISQTPSAKILAMSKIRCLFRKNTSPMDKKSSIKKGKKFTVTDEGSPLVSPVAGNATATKPGTHFGQRAGPAGSSSSTKPASHSSASFPTPGPTPARPSEVAETNALAMSLLNSARYESNSPKKERLLALGKAMVDSITNARDAEKAKEEAKIAASNAEMYYMMAKRSVLDVTNMVREWKEAETLSSLA
ncbi:MAG: hypothetical protein M1813_006954 [Trichoglossum hirsutum]|nr:MAG: hypothetical protein M1813_006954 [Trichoglossum hirsutum]